MNIENWKILNHLHLNFLNCVSYDLLNLKQNKIHSFQDLKIHTSVACDEEWFKTLNFHLSIIQRNI